MHIQNQIFKGANDKESLLDLSIPETFSGKLVLFVHGYMGFKDWGCWNLVADYFLSLGFGFCKYNVSHNGCSIDDPTNFVDLDSFSLNNYSKECQDFEAVLSFIENQIQPMPKMFVVGHSRGGGITILQGGDERISKLVTWAAIAEIESRFPKNVELENWKKNEYYFRKNGRTQQEMPHHYSQYEDFLQNQKSLNIQDAAIELSKPWLIIHGDKDDSVSIDEGKSLAKWSNRELHIVPETNHTFGSSHPWKEKEMPQKLIETCRLTAQFFLGQND
jgi:uncharacterized protein